MSTKPEEIGYAIFGIRDFWAELMKDVSEDSFALFLFQEHGDSKELRRRLACYIGDLVRVLPAWKETAEDIRTAQRRTRQVKKILTS